MMKLPLIKKVFFILSVITLVSCSDEYNGIGANIVGTDLHNGLIKYDVDVTAYDRPTGPVQTNALPLNLLGAYTNPVFGTTKAHYVSQVELETANPTLTSNIQVDSVWLYIPNYSTVESTASDGTTTYTLDSIYGNIDNRFKLRIKRNGYFLRQGDPATGGSEAQKYYSDQKTLFDSYAGASLLDNNAESVDIGFSDAQIERQANYTDSEGNEQTVTAETLAPGIFQYLDKEMFRQLLFEGEGPANLLNNNLFTNYFRGIYLESEQLNNASIMAALNFTEGYIKVIYSQDDLDADGNTQPDTSTEDPNDLLRESKIMVLNLNTTAVNLYENTYNDEFLTAINAANTVEGDDKLYLKGGQGSVAFIDLNEAGLDALREENFGQRVLINEANLVFYIDQQTMAAAKEPLRIYLYDVKNELPIYDYYLDATTVPSAPKYNRYVYGGIKEDDDNDKGLKYKIRLTRHINNIINGDSTNVKLGLAVTETINATSANALKNPFTETDALGNTVNVDVVPLGSVAHPFGTVLYGTGPGVPEDKRLKLEIYYTKPE